MSCPCFYILTCIILSLLSRHLHNSSGSHEKSSRPPLIFQDFRPDVITYTTLMKALIRVEQFDKVSTKSCIMFFTGMLIEITNIDMLSALLEYVQSVQFLFDTLFEPSLLGEVDKHLAASYKVVNQLVLFHITCKALAAKTHDLNLWISWFVNIVTGSSYLRRNDYIRMCPGSKS